MDPKTGASLPLSLACWGPSDHPGYSLVWEDRVQVYYRLFLPPNQTPFSYITPCSNALNFLKHWEAQQSIQMRPWQLLPVAWEAFQCNAMGSLRVHWSALGPAVVQPRSHWVPTSPIHTQPVTQPLRMSLLTDKPAPHFPS